MGTAYWYLEYAKVFLAYLFVMFVYPSVVFRPYLKGKGKAFAFSFCICAQILLVSSVVLFLGLFHILNVWVLRVLFYGSFVWAVRRDVHTPMTPRYLIYKLTNRTYGGKLLWLRMRSGTRQLIRKCWQRLWNGTKHNALGFLVLFAITVYGVVYFSLGPLQLHSYGFSDMPVHHSWIYGLSQGEAFSGGIYPEAMHCFVYAVSALFGIELYNVLLFLQCANVITFFVSAYLLAVELFRWRGTALVMLAAFLTFKLDAAYQVLSMSRLQATLPQEFSLFTVFLIPLFLLRYLKHAGRVTRRGKQTRCCWDSNLVIFCLAIAVSLASHFYTTMMAVIPCLGIVFVRFAKVMHPRRFFPLALSAILALLLACAPMVLAFAEGIPLQGSLYWALRVMQPKQEEQIIVPTVSTVPDEDGGTPQEHSETIPESVAVIPADVPVAPKTAVQRAEELLAAAVKKLEKNWEGVYAFGYRGLYDQKTADWIILMSCLSAALCVLWRIISGLLRRIFRWKSSHRELFDGYLMVTIATMLFVMMYSAELTDFPVLIENHRVCTVNHMLILLLALIPVDLFGWGLSGIAGSRFSQVLGAAAVTAVCVLICSSGSYHGYLYLATSFYNSAVDVTDSVMAEFPRQQYTIVSPTDELYHVVECGFHEELLTFLQNCGKREYYIPTRYVFFYVEKHPIQYNTEHFPDKPEWMGNYRYDALFYNSSQGEDFLSDTISDERADMPLYLGSKPATAYSVLYNRVIVESRMNRYLRTLCMDFPNEINVYYEDEKFICYVLEQNPNCLINFGGRTA